MRKTITIEQLFSGLQPTQYFGPKGSYLAGIGIDPDLPLTDAVGNRLTSGVIRPSAYASFDGAEVNANPVAIITTPKSALIYVVLSNGKLISYDSSFGSETLIGTVTGSVANGAAYYNNYIYIFTGTDVSRYGPLDGTPSLTNTVWTGATLGSLTALVNTTYPSLRGGGTYPNHWPHLHVDGKLYFVDHDSTSTTDTRRGKGLIHFIRTKYGTSGTAHEGAVNDTSTFNALDLPYGFMPVAIESYGTFLVIAAIQTSNSTLNQGRAALFFWDTFSPSFNGSPLFLPDPLVTALKNVNGRLYIFSGAISNGTDVSNGYRVSVYVGGNRVEQVYYSNTGAPPLPGAVEAVGDRLVWGTFEQIPTTTAASPEYYAVVMAYGSKDNRIPKGVHCIAKASATGSAADGLVTAVKNVQQSSFSFPKFVIGWRDASNFGLDQQTTTYGTSIFRSEMFNVGRPFEIKEIRLPLSAAVAANMTLVPTVFFDDISSSKAYQTINSTNFANSERQIKFTDPAHGDHNFFLELRFSGTALLSVVFPITIELDIDEE